MSITKNSVIDQIEIVGDIIKSVQVRTATVLVEDGEELSRSFHRHVIQCVDDYSEEDQLVQDICDVVFTEEMRNLFNAQSPAQGQF